MFFLPFSILELYTKEVFSVIILHETRLSKPIYVHNVCWDGSEIKKRDELCSFGFARRRQFGRCLKLRRIWAWISLLWLPFSLPEIKKNIINNNQTFKIIDHAKTSETALHVSVLASDVCRPETLSKKILFEKFLRISRRLGSTVAVLTSNFRYAQHKKKVWIDKNTSGLKHSLGSRSTIDFLLSASSSYSVCAVRSVCVSFRVLFFVIFSFHFVGLARIFALMKNYRKKYELHGERTRRSRNMAASVKLKASRNISYKKHFLFSCTARLSCVGFCFYYFGARESGNEEKQQKKCCKESIAVR